MKRLAAALLVLIFLLPGCRKEIDETIPNETKKKESCIIVTILSEEREFGGYSGSPCTDGQRGEALVRQVLAQYPAGFAEQWGPVEILLCGELTGEGALAGGHWAAFTQRVGEGWRMVLDVTACDAGTVHHEIAHIIDGILTRAGVLSEEEWMEFCPGGFSYGQSGAYPDYFTDAYAMTDIREDRARTFEDAVRYGPGIYDGRPALWLKLEYFSRAIRGYFDTTGWPEKTIWELALVD